MKIHLKLYGVFGSAAKRSDLELDAIEGTTVRSLVSQLVSQENYRSLKLLLLDSSTSDPRPNALILVSGREVSALNGMDTVLHEGDEIAILPIAHGG
jgi:molybdopterin converting factor small subunit